MIVLVSLIVSKLSRILAQSCKGITMFPRFFCMVHPIPTSPFISPRGACTARVTVVGSVCVCACVCVCVKIWSYRSLQKNAQSHSWHDFTRRDPRVTRGMILRQHHLE